MNSSHATFAYDRQLLLAEIVGDLPWVYDLEAGALSIGDRFTWQAELLGTESDEDDVWLWAWANNASNIPPQRASASLKLKTLGEKHGITELTKPMIRRDHLRGHSFGAIAVGVGLGQAYHRGAFEGGAVLLLITDDRLQFEVDEPLRRILTVFPQAIASLEIADHLEAFQGYVQNYGLEAISDGELLLVRQEDEVLCAEFDDQRRLRSLKGVLGNE